MALDPSPNLPPSIDPIAAQRWERLPLAASPWLHEEVARRMAERLQWITLPAQRWLHWAPSKGGMTAHALLTKQYPKSEVYVAESRTEYAQAAIKKIAPAWWQALHWRSPKLHAGMPAEGTANMVWANMALHSAADPQALLTQWQRALAPQGFLMFSCFGPDTLRELRTLYESLGWPAPSHAFTDMHDWGDMLVHSGYAEPVMDMEHITLSFTNPARLLQELRGLGRNLHLQRFAGLRGRAWHAQLQAELAQALAQSSPAETLAGAAKGQANSAPLQLSFEIIYGHALKAAPRVRVSEHSAVSLADMRAMLQAGKA